MVELSVNKFNGLFQGSIDHNASSIVNAIYDSDPGGFSALIGCPVFLQPPGGTDAALHILPEVNSVVSSSDGFFGILVGGDLDGLYLPGPETFTFAELVPLTLVALPGGPVRVCTQGRCIANVFTGNQSYNIGDPLKAEDGHLEAATSGTLVVARALQQIDQAPAGDSFGFMAVDIQREGILP